MNIPDIGGIATMYDAKDQQIGAPQFFGSMASAYAHAKQVMRDNPAAQYATYTPSTYMFIHRSEVRL